MNKLSLFPVAAAVVVALATGPAMAIPSVCDSTPGNLVLNCGFETGDFTDWTRSGNLGFTEIDRLNPHSGAFALHEGPVSSDGFISQTIATVAGTIYDIGVWYDPSGRIPAELDIEWNTVRILDDLNDTVSGYKHLTAKLAAPDRTF